MIKLENVDIYGWEASIRGLRNPMNSWDKSDTIWGEKREDGLWKYSVPQIGEKDLKLMKSLVKAGSDHRKFLRMINVTMDIVAPLYWWKEFKTYRAGRKFVDDEPDLIPDDYLEYDVEMNSCSTMHKIHSKEFVLDDFSHEHLTVKAEQCLLLTIDVLNDYRESFLECTVSKFLTSAECAETKKLYWWQMIQLLPSSYNQRRTVQLNYEVLLNIYYARRNHKLDEWHEFCDWIRGLPYFVAMCLGEEGYEDE